MKDANPMGRPMHTLSRSPKHHDEIDQFAVGVDPRPAELKRAAGRCLQGGKRSVGNVTDIDRLQFRVAGDNREDRGILDDPAHQIEQPVFLPEDDGRLQKDSALEARHHGGIAAGAGCDVF